MVLLLFIYLILDLFVVLLYQKKQSGKKCANLSSKKLSWLLVCYVFKGQGFGEKVCGGCLLDVTLKKPPTQLKLHPAPSVLFGQFHMFILAEMKREDVLADLFTGFLYICACGRVRWSGHLLSQSYKQFQTFAHFILTAIHLWDNYHALFLPLQHRHYQSHLFRANPLIHFSVIKWTSSKRFRPHLL